MQSELLRLTIAQFASNWMSSYDSPNSAQFYIGVDGGGTRCRARIEDAEGHLLGQGAAGPAATRIGIDRSMQAVRTASEAAAIDAGLSPTALAHASVGVGLAGIDRKGAREALLSFPHPFRKLVYASDANVACLGAHRGHDGGIVVLGTGSIGFAQVDSARSVLEGTVSQSPMREAVRISDFRLCSSPFAHMTAGLSQLPSCSK
jgi:N-acetylglucosamine kinase-like BadF-type ATPase